MLGNTEIALISVPSSQASQDRRELALHLYYSFFLPSFPHPSTSLSPPASTLTGWPKELMQLL